MSEGHYFNITELAATLPETAETMLRDIRLVDAEAASCRIFRTYRPAPMHFHKTCDEYLYVLQGRGLFVIEGDEPRALGPGELVHFKKNTVHGMPQILEHPFVVLAIDTPWRAPDDVHFVDPKEGNAQTFIASQEY
jgi:mannose-6-phosphate isomerase-like protein (cupin superfamily)